MPMIDMPLEKLMTYEGRTPCPPQLDAFWDRALAEMRAIDPEVELRPASFHVPGVECFDLYFTGVGGARVHAKYLRPMVKAKTKPHPAIVQFTGIPETRVTGMTSFRGSRWGTRLPRSTAVARGARRRTSAASRGQHSAAILSAGCRMGPSGCCSARSTSIAPSWPAS